MGWTTILTLPSRYRLSSPTMHAPTARSLISGRFRGFLPVVVDVETGGVNPQTDALLEIAVVLIGMDNSGNLHALRTVGCHIEPFPGSKLDPASMAINKIDPFHPLRQTLSEKEALTTVFKEIRREVRETNCNRAILVGHNAFFDLNFLNAAVTRNGIKRNPFHPFSCFDTVTLAGLALGQTVLARAAHAIGINWDNQEAHSAVYDAECTAAIFCHVVNYWNKLGGWVPNNLEKLI